MPGRPAKITFGDMRDSGVRELLVYCSDYRCRHSIAIRSDGWPDEVRLSDIEPRFVCAACGNRRAEVRPDFNWNRKLCLQFGKKRGGFSREQSASTYRARERDDQTTSGAARGSPIGRSERQRNRDYCR